MNNLKSKSLFTTLILTISLPLISFAQINTDLKLGVKSDQVKELQTYLKSEKLLSGEPTNYFGNLTKKAVIAWQKKNGITPANGVFGKSSRNIFNNISGGNSVSVNTNSLILNKLMADQITDLDTLSKLDASILEQLNLSKKIIEIYKNNFALYQPIVPESVTLANKIADNISGAKVEYEVLENANKNKIEELRNKVLALKDDTSIFDSNGRLVSDKVNPKIERFSAENKAIFNDLKTMVVNTQTFFDYAKTKLEVENTKLSSAASLKTGFNSINTQTGSNMQNVLSDFNNKLQKIDEANKKVKCTVDLTNKSSGYISATCANSY